MNITFACPKCDTTVRRDVEASDAAIECPHCHGSTLVPPDAFENGQLCRCLVCPSTDLFVRKDFPQRLGVGIVATGIIGSSIAWAYTLPIATFAVLFATALIDVLLYLIVPNALMCYRCGAQYRLAEGMDRHGAFNLETHERYRQQAARMAS
jgi:DNA-directed RNA polymerase subunit RPC12/RpoP